MKAMFKGIVKILRICTGRAIKGEANCTAKLKSYIFSKKKS